MCYDFQAYKYSLCEAEVTKEEPKASKKAVSLIMIIIAMTRINIMYKHTIWYTYICI